MVCDMYEILSELLYVAFILDNVHYFPNVDSYLYILYLSKALKDVYCPLGLKRVSACPTEKLPEGFEYMSLI